MSKRKSTTLPSSGRTTKAVKKGKVSLHPYGERPDWLPEGFSQIFIGGGLSKKSAKPEKQGISDGASAISGDDDELPWDEYPGYIGMEYDRECSLPEEWKFAEDFDWGEYTELLEELPNSGHRIIRVEADAESFELEVDTNDACLAYLLPQIPGIVALYMGEDHSLCPGVGHAFLLEEGRGLSEVTRALRSTIEALSKDMQKLRSDQHL
jgi:hypothetical protein